MVQHMVLSYDIALGCARTKGGQNEVRYTKLLRVVVRRFFLGGLPRRYEVHSLIINTDVPNHAGRATYDNR